MNRYKTFDRNPDDGRLTVAEFNAHGEIERPARMLETIAYKARHFCGSLIEQTMAAFGATDKSDLPPTQQS